MKRRFEYRSRTDDMRAFLARQNRLYPAHLVKIDKDDWPEDYNPKQAPVLEVWRSRDFLVQVLSDNGHVRLSVNRTVLNPAGTSWSEGITWDDLMRLKAEAGFGDRWAIEIFPPAAEVVNVANMRHLWLLDEAPPQAWVKDKPGGAAAVMDAFTLHLGESLDVLRSLPDCSVDAVVTDPPYGIRFMGKAWDGKGIEEKVRTRRDGPPPAPGVGPAGGHHSAAAEAGKYSRTLRANRAFQRWTRAWAKEAMRVLKPGGWLLSFSSTRTYHRMTSGLEDAGFEIRDQIGWVFGGGFPKSHNGDWGGTALKPAWEPIAVARKPLAGTVAANWQAHGTGALNIDGCRVHAADAHAKEYTVRRLNPGAKVNGGAGWKSDEEYQGKTKAGRWPANLIHDGSEEVVALFPAEAGAAAPVHRRNGDKFRNAYGAFADNIDAAGSAFHGDSGSAARFFYCAKPSASERNAGCEALPDREWRDEGACVPERGDRPFRPSKNNHPTVKPLALMRYLCRLVTPAGGLILDPFLGSGTTGAAALLEGFRFIGIEREAEYMPIARARIEHAARQAAAEAAKPEQLTLL